MLLSYTIVDIDFYYNNGAVNMQICTLHTRIQCKVSDTQVTVKACGPLVFSSCSKFLFNQVFLDKLSFTFFLLEVLPV